VADHADRNSVRVPAARVCRVHFRLDQGESLVVVAADAGSVSVFRHGFGHRNRDVGLHVSTWARKQTIDMRCVDTIARYLFYTFIIDFSLEMLDLIHRIYESDESFRSLDFMVHTKLYVSHIVVQIFLGTLTPLILLLLTQVINMSEMARKRIYAPRDA
jgi:hypothetical protein